MPVEPALEHISPELALVDPELAAEARAALPDAAVAGPVGRDTRRRRSRLVLAIVAVLAVVGVAAALALVTRDPQERLRPAAPPAAAPRPQPTPARRAASGPQPAAPPRSAPSPAATPRTKPKPKPPPPAAAVLGAKKVAPPAPKTAPAGSPSRLYIWAPAADAVYYDVSFVRDGRPFRVLRTEDSWLRLPSTLQFTPGTYRLTVRPAVVGKAGIVLGTPIVERTFRVGGGG